MQVLKRMTSASVGVVGQLVALPAQAADDELAVEHVHLAADGFDVEFLGHDVYVVESVAIAMLRRIRAGD